MRRTVRGGVRLKGLSQSGFYPSGNPRLYYRRKGEKPVAMPDAPKDSAAFLKAYTEAAAGLPPEGVKAVPRTGTIGAGVLAYKKSDHFLTIAPSTRERWRRMLEDIATRYGVARLVDLEPKHIRKDLARLDPHPANNRLKVWRALGRWWVDAGLLDTDPARDVRPRATPQTDGHQAWTEADAALFRAHWPIGSIQRLAFELLITTGAARVDVVRLGPRNVDDDGWLTYTRKKCGTLAVVPFSCPAPAWYPASPYLAECLARAPRHLTFLSTDRGGSRSDKAFGNWFAAAARAAGIEKGKTAHGVRKLLAVMMAERGAAPEQRMAILGHDTTKQTQHYSKAADAKRIISGTDFSNFSERVGKNAK